MPVLINMYNKMFINRRSNIKPTGDNMIFSSMYVEKKPETSLLLVSNINWTIDGLMKDPSLIKQNVSITAKIYAVK